MTIDTTRMTLARQMVGAYIPINTDVIGLVTESDDCYCRNYCAAVRNTLTGAVGTMIAGAWRTLDPAVLTSAILIKTATK